MINMNIALLPGRRIHCCHLNGFKRWMNQSSIQFEAAIEGADHKAADSLSSSHTAYITASIVITNFILCFIIRALTCKLSRKFSRLNGSPPRQHAYIVSCSCVVQTLETNCYVKAISKVSTGWLRWTNKVTAFIVYLTLCFMVGTQWNSIAANWNTIADRWIPAQGGEIRNSYSDSYSILLSFFEFEQIRQRIRTNSKNNSVKFKKQFGSIRKKIRRNSKNNSDNFRNQFGHIRRRTFSNSFKLFR